MIEDNSMSKEIRGSGSFTCGRDKYDGETAFWYDLIKPKVPKLEGYNLIQICRGTDREGNTVWVEFEYVFNPKGNWIQQWMYNRWGCFHKPKGGWKMQRHFKEEAELRIEDGEERDLLEVVKNETCLTDREVIDFARFNMSRPSMLSDLL